MNCLETRHQFAGFWQKSLAPDDRRAFLAHLAACRACDHAFRIFALTAPALYSDLADSPAAGVSGPRSPLPTGRASDGGRPMNGFVIVAAIAAAITLYLTVPRRVSFEDVIVGGDTGVARTTYSPTENLFWPDGSAPRSDPGQPTSGRVKQKNLAS
jgi:hypothetical protein